MPPPRRLPPGQVAVPFAIGDGHIGFDTYVLVTQRTVSHHYRRRSDGTITYGSGNFRYIWPSECDLMARLAGLNLERRLAEWDGTPFTSTSEGHVSVWRKLSEAPEPTRLTAGLPRGRDRSHTVMLIPVR